jgi:hypothetical protein
MLRPNQKPSKQIFKSMLEMKKRGLVPIRRRADLWRVPSQSIPCQSYTVTVRDVRARLETECTCKAGQANRLCKHQLLVLGEFDRDNRHWIALLAFQEERRAA